MSKNKISKEKNENSKGRKLTKNDDDKENGKRNKPKSTFKKTLHESEHLDNGKVQKFSPIFHKRDILQGA